MPAMDQKALAEIKKIESAKDYQNPRYMELLIPNFYVHHILRMPADQWPDPVNRAFKHLNESIYILMQGPSEMSASGRLEKWDRTADLPKIAVPTLTIGAQYDTMDPRHMEMMAKQVQKGRYLYCPNGSHLAMYDDQKTYMAGVTQVHPRRRRREVLMTTHFTHVSRRTFLQASVAGVAAVGLQSSAAQKVPMTGIKALVFDVFGTVVDWRTSVAREAEALAKSKGPDDRRAEVRRRVARAVRPDDGSRAQGHAAVDQARSAAPDDPRSDRGRLRLLRPHGDRARHPQSRVASAAAVARQRRGPGPAQEAVHHRAAVERQHRAHDRSRPALGPAVGTVFSAPNSFATTSPIPRCISRRRSCSISSAER
jgi:hypothetical protein